MHIEKFTPWEIKQLDNISQFSSDRHFFCRESIVSNTLLCVTIPSLDSNSQDYQLIVKEQMTMIHFNKLNKTHHTN